jgi:hypothetical protein
MLRNPLVGFSCLVWLLAFYVEARAQVQIPGVRLGLETRASLGVAYLEQLMLGACQQMFPETPHFKTTAEGLNEAAAELENIFSKQEIDAIRNYVGSRYEKVESLLTTSPQASSQCSQTSQIVAAQIASGMFSGAK